jgi:hypothetical protein
MARITQEQVEAFASDEAILRLASSMYRHIQLGGVVIKFGVSMAVARRRLMAMQERGLVERLGNGQYRVKSHRS